MRQKLPMQELELKMQGAYVQGGCNCGILWYLCMRAATIREQLLFVSQSSMYGYYLVVATNRACGFYSSYGSYLNQAEINSCRRYYLFNLGRSCG